MGGWVHPDRRCLPRRPRRSRHRRGPALPEREGQPALRLRASAGRAHGHRRGATGGRAGRAVVPGDASRCRSAEDESLGDRTRVPARSARTGCARVGRTLVGAAPVEARSSPVAGATPGTCLQGGDPTSSGTCWRSMCGAGAGGRATCSWAVDTVVQVDRHAAMVCAFDILCPSNVPTSAPAAHRSAETHPSPLTKDRTNRTCATQSRPTGRRRPREPPWVRWRSLEVIHRAVTRARRHRPPRDHAARFDR